MSLVKSLAAGWPRRWVPWTAYRGSAQEATQLKPVPWINGAYPEQSNDWLAFPPERSFEAYFNRACVVCGERLDGAVVFGSATEGRRETAGPGGHPRCLWLAANTCPNLMRKMADTPVAWLYFGEGRGHVTDDDEDPYSDGVQVIDEAAVPLTREQLRALAKRDPLGIGTRLSVCPRTESFSGSAATADAPSDRALGGNH